MSFLDDIKSLAEKSVEESFSNVQSYIAQTVLEAPPLIKIGPNPGGNLSQAQIKAGAKSPAPVVAPAPHGDELENSNNFGMGSGGMVFGLPVLAILGAVAVYFVMKKG